MPLNAHNDYVTDALYGDEDEELVDENAVRELLATLGFPNPSADAVMQTKMEAIRALREQRLQELASAYVADVDRDPRTCEDDDERRNDAPQRGLTTEYVDADIVGEAGGLVNRTHDSYLQRDSSLLSATGRTASTPAGAPARTPTSNHGNKRNSAARKMTRAAPGTHRILSDPRDPAGVSGARDGDGDAFESRSSRRSTNKSSSSRRSAPLEPYYARPKEPVHLQHFEPYIKLMLSASNAKELSQPVLHDIPSQLPQRSDRKATNVSGVSGRPATASSIPVAKNGTSRGHSAQRASVPLRHSNVLYAFTGDPKHKWGGLTPRGATTAVAKHSDPVTRGAQMRSIWNKDTFLTQEGRKEERWQVRQSMLAWGGGN